MECDIVGMKDKSEGIPDMVSMKLEEVETIPAAAGMPVVADTLEAPVIILDTLSPMLILAT